MMEVMLVTIKIVLEIGVGFNPNQKGETEQILYT